MHELRAMRSCLVLLCFAACTPETDGVTIELAPDVISSIDGTLAVHAIALAERQPAAGETIRLSVEYQDRHGTPHTITGAEGTTDETGAFDATLTGLTFDGTGTVTAEVVGIEGATASATFAVLDRTPPQVTITPPANNQVRIGADVSIAVHVTDEIGVSQVFFQTGQGFERDRGTIIASGAADTTVTFDLRVGDNAVAGQMIELFALAADLSGNEAAAEPVTVMVVP